MVPMLKLTPEIEAVYAARAARKAALRADAERAIRRAVDHWNGKEAKPDTSG